jgi:hypothetical protein
VVNTRWPATTVASDSCRSSARRKKISSPNPSSTPGNMIGIVNSSRAVSVNRMPPRTSGNAAMVPMSVARTATTAATSIELSTAVWIDVSRSISPYQRRVSPWMGRPGVSAVSNENRMRNAIGI